MKILALDTSSDYCSAALSVDGRTRQLIERAGQRHSQLLLPMVHRLLAAAELAVKSLDGVAVAVGPGSFTGVRIATAVGQGLAFGADLPVAAIGSLEAIAWGQDAPAVIVCTDARMGEVYFAAYRRDCHDLLTVIPPCVIPPAAVAVGSLEADAWRGAGNAFSLYGDLLAARLSGRLTSVDTDARTEARWVAALACARFPEGFVAPPEALIPTYVRDKVALTMAER